MPASPRRVSSSRHWLVLLLASVLLALAACGSGAVGVSLHYDPATGVTPAVPNADSLKLYVDQFSAVKGVGPTVIGDAKTGFFGASTPIVLKEELEVESAGAFRAAFARAGFKVVTEEAEADLILKARFEEFWVQETVGFTDVYSDARVGIDLTLIDRVRGDTIWSGVKTSYARNSSFSGMTSKSQMSINQALNDVIASILRDSQFVAAVASWVEASRPKSR